MVMVVLASLLSGCASARTRQELARLQSQVGLLDERIAQLERSNLADLSSPAPGESSGQEAAIPTEASSVKSAVTVSAKGSARSSLKPTTRDIQQALKNAGFYQGAVDGKMGPMTKEAVKEFQRVHGLHDDGVVGRQTWAKLRAYADLSASGGEATAAEVLK
ncbi:MAG: peptidoglycan-binding protein [Candidatus Omnitrophica bacterium]|nr:peptidoglycan-binding protein [Candidatus Omnitrophota bacterium]